MSNVKAVLMAGGFGTRIQPLTASVPKPMLPVVNFPMMEHILKKLKRTGIDEVVILLYFKPDVIKNYFKDGSKWGVKIHYVLPDDDYGTAGAVKFAQEFLDTTFMVVSGDLVTDFDFKKIISEHRKKNSKLSIALTSVENPLEFGIVITDENQKIEKFLEKPSWGEVFSDTINTGIYVIEPEILDFIPLKENFDFAKNLFPLLMEKGIDLYGINMEGYWRDVGNPDSYREVHQDILNERLNFEIPGKVVEYPDGKLYLTGDSQIDNSVEIVGNVVIGNNVKLGKGVKLNNVVIGDNVEIGENGKIRNSVLWHDIKIGKNFILDNGVICENNEIGDNVEAKAGLILARNCKIGDLVKIEQDVTIWPDKKIDPASIVNNNIVFGDRYKSSIFEHGSVVGKSNIEFSCDMATKLAEAFATVLPVGAKIATARDKDKSARMLKRSFLGGLLSSGINVVDLGGVPISVLRHEIYTNPEIVGGVYFKQSSVDPFSTEATFFNEHGLRISTNTAKAVEKAFFKEKFRRVDYYQIGKIYENDYAVEIEKYKNAVKETVDFKIITSENFRIAVDMMHGILGEVFPEILTELEIEHITLNSYYDERKLFNLPHLENISKKDMSNIVKSLGLKAGFMLYPNGEKILIITEEGEVLDKIKGLLVVLNLVDIHAKNLNTKLKVFLPVWAPDIVKFENLEITYGKYTDFKLEDLQKYYLVATVEGSFAFTEFVPYRDTMYATLKILEFLNRYKLSLAEISKNIVKFFYKHCEIPCPQIKKGKIMKKFIQEAKGKKHSLVDGVKIWENDTDWILLIPDQYGEFLHLYMQAKNEEIGNKLHKKYEEKIKNWMEN
ncbi:sugar phosphate nucleotidyltransferase [Hydrogenothermus marinus]|uniref:Mannose-1-phosphate guanylyltransferase/phosphomannomutase n=1 Tax=Hydrogenothermus marinus TaxID=133270 RepID=A0A3M0BJT2_9AQUI|nr:sugar phosphate nucleotidyltransferase [Hydrogenothermus marinus]RMA97703.1 mannose-1-phosphate guanylyltransferase/phosphomannomutase [Hydrogenothermus marinus]